MEAMPSTLNPPTLQRVVGALIYGAPEPLDVKSLCKILHAVAAAHENNAGPETAFADVDEAAVLAALEGLRHDLEQQPLGIQLVEMAGGYRFFTDPECSPWIRHALGTDRPARLSRPALETLAVVAYRQPVSRSEIEAVRGVNVDHVVRNLMEMQLVRITGRSELPGRPLLYGTTQKFLEHFGLKNLRELPGIDELARRANNARETVPPDDGSQSPDKPLSPMPPMPAEPEPNSQPEIVHES